MKGSGCYGSLEAMMGYIVHSCGPAGVTRNVLCGLCYFSDRKAAISGSAYIRSGWGPVPAGFDSALDEMVRRRIVRRVYRGSTELLVPVGRFDAASLTGGAVSAMDAAISRYGHMTERMLGWIAREDMGGERSVSIGDAVGSSESENGICSA